MDSCKQGLIPYSLRFEMAGNAVAATFPTMSRRATFTYGQNLAILGVALSTALLADAGAAPSLVVALLMNQDADVVAFSQDSGALAHHVAYRNTTSASNYYQPSVQTTHYYLPESYGFYLPRGMPISLYASTDGTATSQLNAIATLYAALAR